MAKRGCVAGCLKRVGCLAILLIGAAWVASRFLPEPSPVYYGAATTEDHRALGQWLADWGGVEFVIDEFNERYALSEEVTVSVAECGEVNAYYQPEVAGVLLCYELLADARDRFVRAGTLSDELESTVTSTVLFVLYHELGHALIHLFDLPVTGLEENVVDQLATLTLLDAGREGADAALRGANWFMLGGAGGAAVPYWDEHALNQQRFYNVVCWVYGSAPASGAPLIENWGLPMQRAERCPTEFDRMARGWDRLLEPHRN